MQVANVRPSPAAAAATSTTSLYSSLHSMEFSLSVTHERETRRVETWLRQQQQQQAKARQLGWVNKPSSAVICQEMLFSAVSMLNKV